MSFWLIGRRHWHLRHTHPHANKLVTLNNIAFLYTTVNSCKPPNSLLWTCLLCSFDRGGKSHTEAKQLNDNTDRLILLGFHRPRWRGPTIFLLVRGLPASPLLTPSSAVNLVTSSNGPGSVPPLGLATLWPCHFPWE